MAKPDILTVRIPADANIAELDADRGLVGAVGCEVVRIRAEDTLAAGLIEEVLAAEDGIEIDVTGTITHISPDGGLRDEPQLTITARVQ